MGNVSTHTIAGVGGTALGAAIITILTVQFHMDAALASAWLLVLGVVVVSPVLAYLGIKAKADPALAAALDAITAASKQSTDEGGPPATVETKVVAPVVPPQQTAIAVPVNPAISGTGTLAPSLAPPLGATP